jgi:hypothetical protein
MLLMQFLIWLLAFLLDQPLHTYVIQATSMKQDIWHVFASLMVHGMVFLLFVLVCQYIYTCMSLVSSALSFVEIQWSHGVILFQAMFLYYYDIQYEPWIHAQLLWKKQQAKLICLKNIFFFRDLIAYLLYDTFTNVPHYIRYTGGSSGVSRNCG